MTDNLYSVVLVFNACDEAVRASVRTFLENRYRMSMASGQLDKALDKGRLLIQRDRTRSDAQSIHQGIHINGAVCRLKKQSQHLNNTCESPNGVSRGPYGPSEHDGSIICPKCQTRQL